MEIIIRYLYLTVALLSLQARSDMHAGLLHEAAKKGDWQTIKAFFEPTDNYFSYVIGAPLVIFENPLEELYVRDEGGFTPLEYAVLNKQWFTELLLEYYDPSRLCADFILNATLEKKSSFDIIKAYVTRLPCKKLFHFDDIKKLLKLNYYDNNLYEDFIPRAYFWDRSMNYLGKEETAEPEKFIELAAYAIKYDNKGVADAILQRINFEAAFTRFLEGYNSEFRHQHIYDAITCIKGVHCKTVGRDFIVKKFPFLYHRMVPGSDFYGKLMQTLLKEFDYEDRHDKKGNTALHIAVLWGDEASQDLLLKYGANPNMENNNYKTPLQLLLKQRPNPAPGTIKEHLKRVCEFISISRKSSKH